MKESLKQVLLMEIKINGIVPYEQIVRLTMEFGARVSAAERRLRESTQAGLITPIMKRSKKNTEYISAYRWNFPVFTSAPIAPPEIKQTSLI